VHHLEFSNVSRPAQSRDRRRYLLIKRTSAFLHYIDALYTPVLDRLDRFSTAEPSPRLNEAVLADLQTDPLFFRDAGHLHDNAILSHFGPDRPITDDSRVDSLIFKHGRSIEIRFLIFLFTETLGNSATHAAYTLTRSVDSPGIVTVTYGCGLRDEYGQFWFPRTDKYFGRLDPLPERSSDWVVYATKTYGQTSLARYLNKKSR